MKLKNALLLFPMFWLSAGVLAETMSCPDIANAVQVGTCPTEEELQYTFNGFCSDNARMYDRENDVCKEYTAYRELKNVSLWETRDGRFDGYVSCNPEKAGLANAKANSVKVSKQGSVTRMACGYSTGVTFTYRTKAKCTADAANCASDPAACKATCD